jgi:hypothetical protein
VSSCRVPAPLTMVSGECRAVMMLDLPVWLVVVLSAFTLRHLGVRVQDSSLTAR